MPRLLPFLLVSLLLFATACKREEAEPSLEGRWNSDSTTAYFYAHDGKLLDEVTSVGGTPYIVVTGKRIQYLSSSDDKLLGASEITQQGEIVKPDGKPQTITRLTTQNLTLLDKTATGVFFGGNVELATHYVR